MSVFGHLGFGFVPGIAIFIVDETECFHTFYYRRLLYVSTSVCGTSTGQLFDESMQHAERLQWEKTM
jgi:hypothetical protein